MQRCQIR